MAFLRKRGSTWYARYIDPKTGKRRDKSLSTDKGVAEQLLAQLKRKIEGSKLGWQELDVADEIKRPIDEHLANWRESVLDGSNTLEHADRQRNRAQVVLAGCGFTRISQIDDSKVGAYLAKRRRQDRTKADGKRTMGFGVTTSNHHLRAIKSFTRWLWRSKRLPTDPLAGLRQLNAAVDRRHVRRSISAEELQTLLTTTKQSERIDKGKDWRFSGTDRWYLYLTASYTGLRASELASLTPSNFDFKAKTLKVKALNSKHRKEDILPLMPQLATTLQRWLKSRKLPADAQLWAGSWAKAKMGGKMLRRDLKVAGIPAKDKQGEVFDFHALRGQFISTLARSGANPKQVQTLARHCNITLTMDVYARLGIGDVAPALDLLPAIPA